MQYRVLLKLNSFYHALLLQGISRILLASMMYGVYFMLILLIIINDSFLTFIV